ncbi:Fc receptor-like protein 3 isoform 1-T1 [Anomaloglossus baeobatrachus]
MAVLALITLTALIMENSGQRVRYVITRNPDWNHIYTGDSVTLNCDIGANENIDNYNFYWYKNDIQIQQRVQEFTIHKAAYYDGGEYKCWIGFGDRSHPLRLYVINKDNMYRRPTVIFSPNYRNIFDGEKMEISCEDESAAIRNQKYEWYKDNERLRNDKKSITMNRALSKHSGDYRCRLWSKDSYPIRLDIYPKYRHKIILQIPPDIVEGDRLDLRCHSSEFHNDEEDTAFYKDGAVIQTMKHILQLPSVNKSMTGRYRCEKKLEDGTLLKAEETYIHVQDIFTSPKIKVPFSIKEGDTMTLTCDTRCNPLREDTDLLFTFYKNGQKVQEIGSSDTYSVRSTQLEDSGHYTCEAQTPSHTVMKMSDVSYISIEELFEKPKLQIKPERINKGDRVTMKCLYSEWLYGPSYTFYRDSQTVQPKIYKNEYVILHASEKDTGNYQCSLTYKSISKNSSEQMIIVKIPVNKPNLMVSPNNVAVEDEAVFRCLSSKGSRPIQYLFYHNESLLINITAHKKEAAEIKFTITSLTMGGLYSCASYNDVQTQHQHSDKVNLQVMEPVSDIDITTDKEGEDFVLGESLTFTCTIQRGTSISVSWLHNNTVVKQNSELYQIQDNEKILYIDSLQHYHEGTYQCNAKNELSVNRTFSVLSEIRKVTVNINILEQLNADDRTIWWSMLGILLLVIIIVGVLIITFRKKMFAAQSCRKKTPSTEMRTTQNNEDDNIQNPITSQGVYANIPIRKDLDHEDDGCTYITVNAVHAPSYPGDVLSEDFTVLYSKVKPTNATSGSRAEPKTLEMSDTIYDNITADNLNADYH